MDNLMNKSQCIKIYCRLKPLKQKEKSIKYEITNNERSGVDVLDLKHQPYRNNHDTYKYSYNGVFNENTSQSLIFETVAVPILEKFLTGMNSTIFAYGQTCSGKTFTMYGTKDDRGIIPRSLEYLFKYTEELNFEFQMEYVEIYKNNIYDLLEKKNNNMPTNNKIKYGIGKGGNIDYKRKINTVKIKKIQQALSLLEMGNAKKNIACTSSNITSSRSHCICTIKFKKEQDGPEIKFNLVDLAGSENISNTTDDKKTLIESRSINSSLHHLNHVIRSLANPKVYVPYRNSTITSVLKDSLGTECATAMISTVVLNHRCIASKDVLLEEKEHDMSGGFRSKVKENKIVLVDKTTNTENNEYLINESIDIPRVLYDKLKDDGICMNVTYDVHDDRYKLDDFAIGDGIICVPAVDVTAPSVMEYGDEINDTHDNSKMTKDDGICMNVTYDVHEERYKLDDFAIGDGIICVPAVDVTPPPVMESGDGINDTHDNSKMTEVRDVLPLFVECGIGTEDILVTQSEHDDKNIYTPLKNSLINRASNFYWRHYKMIQLILITIILMLNSQFFISTVEFDIHSFVPEWLKSWDPAKLCPDGINNLQTFCCCGKCLRVCVKTTKEKINEKVIDSFCDCQLASCVTDSPNTDSDHRLFKSLTWSDQMFDEYLTFIKSTVKISICVFIMLFITILIAMVLYKLFRLQQSSNDTNFDKSNTQNNKQPSPITVNIGLEKLPTCTDEKCQPIYLNTKVQQYLNNEQPSPTTVNVGPEKLPTSTDEKCQHVYFNKKFGSRAKVHYGRQYRRQVTPDEYRPREYVSSRPITEIDQSSSPSSGQSSATVTAKQTPTTQLQERSTINLHQGRISRNTSQCLADHQSSEDHRSETNALDETTKATKTPKTEKPRSGFKRYGFRRWI